MNGNHFDYIIVGNGLAGLQLALAFAEDPFFKDKTFALIDKSPKNYNDKTWSFWEVGNGKWDHIVSKTWKHSKFLSSKKSYNLDLEPYTYKTIRSIDFYNYAKSTLSRFSNFQFIRDSIENIKEAENIIAAGKSISYSASYIFDSRIPSDYFSKNKACTKIFQHFKGWVIEVTEDLFNPEEFTVMDYRLKHNDDTTFTYVLPFSKRKALVEFTFFTPYTVEPNLYDDYLKRYINDYLKCSDYTIIESEQGIIPMTDFPFKNYNTKYITKIGTAGGWVKPSTGYSFKHTEKNVTKILKNIKSNREAHAGIHNKKHIFLDKVFLKVLKDENQKGEWIFEQFYTKNSSETMFKFLDNESSFKEDVSIMLSLFSWSFIRAFFKS